MSEENHLFGVCFTLSVSSVAVENATYGTQNDLSPRLLLDLTLSVMESSKLL